MTRPNSKLPPRENFTYQRLYRSRTNRVIAGVAGGLGEYFDIDPTLIRVIFILITIFGGSGIIIYLALWLIVPYKSSRLSEGGLEDNVRQIREQARRVSSEIRISSRRHDSRVWWGILIMVTGVLFLFNNFGFFTIFSIVKIWPFILIVFGLAVLLKR